MTSLPSFEYRQYDESLYDSVQVATLEHGDSEVTIHISTTEAVTTQFTFSSYWRDKQWRPLLEAVKNGTKGYATFHGCNDDTTFACDNTVFKVDAHRDGGGNNFRVSIEFPRASAIPMLEMLAAPE